MTITVIGSPAAQGSKKHVGNGVMIESSKKVRPWRCDVKLAAMDESLRLQKAGEPFMVHGPVNLHVVFTLPKPKSAPKTRRIWPDKKPDIDKLVRCVSDSLTDAGVWEDDARIVRLVATKCYPGEGADSLHIPGCVIHISEVKE